MVNIQEAIVGLRSVRLHIEQLKEQEAQLAATISQTYQAQISEQLSGKDYGCGTASVPLSDNLSLKFEIGKTVKWDQDGLANMFAQIRTAGRDPLEYMKVKYDVAENAYKNWPSDIRGAFEPFRTVTPSKPKVIIIEQE